MNATGAVLPKILLGVKYLITSRQPQVGLTATPKETKDVSNSHYFGEPVYTYSLRDFLSTSLVFKSGR